MIVNACRSPDLRTAYTCAAPKQPAPERRDCVRRRDRTAVTHL